MFTGIRSAGIAILESADRHFKAQNVENMEISCANGITKGDIETLLARNDIITAEGEYSANVTTRRADELLILQALSIGNELNVPTVLEGTLSVNADEAAIEEQYATKKGLHVGDTLTVSHDGALLFDSFKITAIVNDPRYCYYTTKDTRGETSIGTGDVSFYICLKKEAFSSEHFDNCYTAAHMKRDISDSLYSYSDEYNDKSAKLKKELEEFGKTRSSMRYDDLYERAKNAIAAIQPDAILAQEQLDALGIMPKDWIVLERNMTGDILAVETVLKIKLCKCIYQSNETNTKIAAK